MSLSLLVSRYWEHPVKTLQAHCQMFSFRILLLFFLEAFLASLFQNFLNSAAATIALDIINTCL